MTDHSWLLTALRDIEEYAVMNRLELVVPVVGQATRAVERALSPMNVQGYEAPIRFAVENRVLPANCNVPIGLLDDCS